MKTIKTDTHLLLVDETAEIKTPCTFYNQPMNEINFCGVGTVKWKDCFKIIVASPKLGDLPEFETLSPNTEDDVEKLANDLMKKYIHPAREKEDDVLWSSIKNAIIAGYNQAKSETGFSLDNMKKSMFEVYKNGLREPKDGKENFNEIYNRVIRTLTKPKEYEFVPEMEQYTQNYHKDIWYNRPKIVNNKIQGEWKEIIII